MSATWRVSSAGDDRNDGSADRPLRSIGAAAARAHAGDTVLVGAGVYRERVDPPRGGASATEPITYAAVPGEHVVLTGSDVFTGWEERHGNLWELTVPSSYFGDFHPYAEVVHGDWFDGMDRAYHRGNVFLDGAWLPEVVSREALQSGAGLGWVCAVDGLVDRPSAVPYLDEGHAAFDAAVFDPAGDTRILARFPDGVDPNGGRVEVSVRRTVFTPTAEHIDFITVRGFEIRNAATNWAAPTAGQEALVTAYWCRGWVIEDNEICYSRCAGIALGKNRDEFDGESGTTDGYYSTIAVALDRDGWSKGTIGSHTVRNNHIHHCGQVGIVGSLGGAFSTIEGNEIHDCNLQGTWTGAETGGIKLHGAIDVTITHNHIHRCGGLGGIWLDWMAQGTRITANLLHDNIRDLYLEVDHGPILVTENILLSTWAYICNSGGVAVAHNLITGQIEIYNDEREVPYFRPHSTELVTMRHLTAAGDAHWWNNILTRQVDLRQYDKTIDGVADGFETNVVLGAAATYDLIPEPFANLEEIDGAWWLTVRTLPEWRAIAERISADSFGLTKVTQQPYTGPDGSRIVLDEDYLGAPRGARVTPGPFEPPAFGAVQVWPRQPRRVDG